MAEFHPLRPLGGHVGEESETLRRNWKDLDKSAETVGKSLVPATMPSLDHSSMADYHDVYEPSDDTYLLIDAIKHDLFFEHPSDIGDGDETMTLEEKDGKESVARAALECYYRLSRSSTAKETTRDEQIVRDLVESKGWKTDQSKAIISRLQQLKRLDTIQTVMEIGTGSGVPISYLAKQLLLEKPRESLDGNGSGFSVIATDLNPLALKFAQKTAKENGVVVSEDNPDDVDSTSNNVRIRSLRFEECDLATPLLDELEGSVDVLIFNPPYVPTEDSEVSGSGIAISWAGGTDGRLVVDRALPQITRLLRKPSGVCYMITVDDNLPSQMATILRENFGLSMVPLVRRRARNEYLSVQTISWPRAEK